jgi:hypothetical protein
MNTIQPLHADTSSLSLKLKQLLKRYNIIYEERQEGNAFVIEIKARPISQQASLYLNKLQTGFA